MPPPEAQGVFRWIFLGVGCGAGFILAALLLAVRLAEPALALEELPGEAERIKACEKQICSMILSRETKGADFKCEMSKTWAQSALEGGKSKGISWMFGDARCTANVVLTRADLIGALTAPKYTIKLPPQTVKCVVERSGETKPVTITLAPKLKFKDGQADKVWINLKEISGPEDVKGTVWTAASLEDTLGIFHKPMIKGINKFVHTQCAKRYGPNAKPETAEAKPAPAAAPAKASAEAN